MSDFEYENRLWPRIKNAFRLLVAFTFSHVGVCGLVIGYIICGAFLFQMIESTEEDHNLEKVRRLREETADRLLLIVLKTNNFDEEEFINLTNKEIANYTSSIVYFINEGFEGEPTASSSSSSSSSSSKGSNVTITGTGAGDDVRIQWSFSGAFLYSLTVITTIGYGNVAPRSASGKLTTILYGIIGMPLFLLYLSNIGNILARGFKWTFARCCQCRWNCVRRRRYLDNDQEVEEEEEQITVPISVCLALMVGYIWGGGLLFAKWEGWSVMDASYFCFISLSTIGFGDLVPGDAVYAEGLEDAIQLSFVFCSLYLLLGMALIAMCFQIMQEEVLAKVRGCGRRLGCIR